MNAATQTAGSSGQLEALRRRRGMYADTLRTYLKLVDQLPNNRVLDRLILRMGSRRALDLLALHATNGRMRCEDVFRHVLQRGSTLESLARLAGGPVDPEMVVRIARIAVLQAHGEAEKSDGLRAMEWIYRQEGWEPFRPDHARLFQNLAFDLGEFELADALAAGIKGSRLDALIMKADLANPHGPSSFADESEWVNAFGRIFRRDGIEAPSLLEVGSGDPFDRLACVSDVVITDGPLVSIIVTSWQPGTGLVTAIRSLINQSWRNLEILLVDDASPDSYLPILNRAAALDPRVKLIRLDRNGGTYQARNHGLRAATGEFVTGQDSDDWSHPRRIEKQVKVLLKSRRRISTTSHAFRCDPALVFNAPGTQARRENASSLMFRRSEVLERVGFYDATRKGGDTEYMLRIRRVFGEKSHRTLEHNLAMIRQSRGSLSTAEFKPGWRHPSRAAYRRSYEFWHANCEPDALRLEHVEERPNRFPLPARFRVTAQPDPELDIVFTDDMRGVTGPLHLRVLLDEINVALRAGLKVGVMHLRSLRDMGFERIDTFWTPISRLLQEGKVHEVLSTDAFAPSLLVVRRPEVALFLSPTDVSLRPQRIVVAATEPLVNGRGEIWYCPVACDRNLRDAFGCRPEWRVEPELSSQLKEILPRTAIVGSAYPVIVDVSSWRSPARDFAGRRPVIGRIAADGAASFPRDREKLLGAYPPTGRAPTKFLGGEAELRTVLGDRPMPASWTVLSEEALGPDVFLSSCDFFVYFDHGAGSPTPVRLFAQAMASGCVVISSQRHAAGFQGAVIEATPEDVYSIVASVAREKEKFFAQVELGRRYLEQASRGVELPGMALSSLPMVPTRKSGALARAGKSLPEIPEVVRDYLEIAEKTKDSLRLDATILRTGSENGRELLARLASRGRLSFLDLIRYVEATRVDSRRAHALAILAEFDPHLAIRLARVLVLQALRPDDLLNGVSLCEAIVSTHGTVVPRKWGAIFINAALRLDRYGTALAFEKLLKLNKHDRRLVEIDLLHPRWTGNEEDWLKAFNSIFNEWGLNGLQLRRSEGESARLDRVGFIGAAEMAVASEYKVTVIITTWRPGAALRSAVLSVLAQTWQNLEVLIIDDGSPPQYDAILGECAQLDPRVQVLSQKVNQGTYVARNRGLVAATGDFVTFQDSDDYSHPRRIELQVLPMIKEGSVMATKSASLRLDEQMLLANPGSPAIQGNASSLMIRRAEVVERVGFFDSVRKAADTEYAMRISAAFEGGVVGLDEKMPLALVRLEPNSLSRAEFKPGWRHPSRRVYREAYELWHRRIRLGEATPFLERDSNRRPFPAPKRFRVDRDTPSDSYDVVFIGDWRQYGGPQKSMIEEIRALSGRGLRMSICHLEAFRFMTREKHPLCEPVRVLVQDGVVDEITTFDPIDVRLAILRYPPILQYLQAEAVEWNLASAIIVANQAPNERNGEDVRYCVSDCVRNARALFGLDPIWIPQGPLVREALEPLIPPALIDPVDMPGILKASEWRLEERDENVGVPVIGRYSRDNLLKFPSTATELLQAYPSSDEVKVRIMGGVRACETLLGGKDVPRNWEVMAYGELGVREFLRGIDYFVYFDNDQIVEAFGRSILEAIASGRIVLLPEKFRPAFGDAALYCEAAEVMGLVRKLHSDAEFRSRIRERVANELQARFSHQSYFQRISGMLAALKCREPHK
ncbi:glycosyltransferase family 2 protein [Novilysobacter defluvii]|nr:glycosyltransferase [Lysobacter defluvii]